MSQQLFIDQIAHEEPDSHSYYEFIKDSIGKGSGKYYNGIGEVYRATSRYQKGYGMLGMSGNRHRHTGRGLGNILRSLWRTAFPMIQTGAKKLGTAALDVATNVAQDVLKGRDIKESAKEHLTTKGLKLLETIKPSAPGDAIPSPATTKEPSPPPPPPPATLTSPEIPKIRKLVRKRPPPVISTKVRKKQFKYPALKFM